MSNVTLVIGGRDYTVACAAGEESHILKLGKMIDDKLAKMGDLSGQSEARTLLFASLFLADEVHELSRQNSSAPAPVAAPAADPKITQHLASIATKLENLATRLEG